MRDITTVRLSEADIATLDRIIAAGLATDYDSAVNHAISRFRPPLPVDIAVYRMGYCGDVEHNDQGEHGDP